MAIGKNDTFDFLIDIVPREDSKAKKSDVINIDTFLLIIKLMYFRLLTIVLPWPQIIISTLIQLEILQTPWYILIQI